MTQTKAGSNAYRRSGVDIDAGSRATALMSEAVRSTYGAEVLAGIGAFSGLFDVSAFKQMESPVLVASTDGVGTKTKIAATIGRWNTIGQDIVNHCINDILVQGAEPLFFLDYVAASRLEPEQVASIVSGVAEACRDAGCALLGGETAEMPGVYQVGEVDLAGTIIGVVERRKIIDGSQIRPGDTILALPSSGLHTNGYSLARQALEGMDWNEKIPELGDSINNVLLAVHRSYLAPIRQLRVGGVEIRGLAHITGGGVIDNLPRILPDGVGAVLKRGTWVEPPIFKLIQRRAVVSDDEMFHIFNMGLGMLVIIPQEQIEMALQYVSELLIVGNIHANGEIAIEQGG